MFVINANHPPNMQEYGIQLPVPPARFINCKSWVLDNIAPTHIQWLESNLYTKNDLLRCHTTDYVDALAHATTQCVRTCFELDQNPSRFIDNDSNKPLAELAERIIYHSGGTYLASKLALSHQHCFFVGGGYHHALSHGPSGFCLVNDIAVAIRKLQSENKIKTAWVIDVDAHMGDGVAQIAQEDSSIITLSIHMAHGWPLQENTDYPIKSDIDIPVLQNDEANYNTHLQKGLEKLVDLFPKADLIIFNQGSDPFEKDTLGSTALLNLTAEQMLTRDIMLFEFASSLKIPACYVLSGGYGPYAHQPTIAFWNYLKRTHLWPIKKK